MRPGCGEHSDPPRSPLEQLARRFLAPPSQGLRGLRMDEALERRQLDARPGASARGHVPTVPRLCPHPAHLRPSHIAATGCRSRPHGARMVSDGLRECGPQASNLRVGGSTPSGRTTRDGHFGAVRVSSRPPTVPELCPYGRSDPGRPLHAPRPWSTTPSARGLLFCQPSAAHQATTDQDSLARLSPSRLLTVRKRLLLPT